MAGMHSLRELARGLTERNIPTPRGGTWNASQVRALLPRLESAN